MSYSLAFWHAVSTVTFIAVKMNSDKFDYLTTSHISEILNIPHSTIRKILKQLTMAGLLETKEGAKGGVILTRSANEITLLDIFYAVEQKNPLFKTGGVMDDERAKRMAERVKNEINNSMKDIKTRFNSVTIQNLLDE